jgi:guanine deaminase
VRGRLFWLAGDPERDGPPIQVSDDVVVCLDGQIVASGPRTELHRRIPADTVVHRYPDHLVIAGFVDAYTHHPRTNVVARHADWLDRHVYPEEARFASPEYAATGATVFRDELLRKGTTTALVFSTSHPTSVDAIFAAAADTDMRVVAARS